jgi:hypothetical protein
MAYDKKESKKHTSGPDGPGDRGFDIQGSDTTVRFRQ